ncbi:MAG: helix-turn-helix domain-containing protein [Gemmatimonadales bacterium]
MGTVVTVSAAAWYTDPKAGKRPVSHGPRALDARGLATMHHLLVQLSEVELRPRFAEACRAFGDVVWCDDVDGTVGAGGGPQVLAVLVDVVDGRAGPPPRPWPVCGLGGRGSRSFIWCDRTGSADFGAFARGGVSAIVPARTTTSSAGMLSSVTRANDVAFQQLDQDAPPAVPSPFIPLVRFCLDHAAQMPAADIVASSMGLSPRALSTQLRRAGLPPLGALVSWSRVLVAAYRLEKSTAPVGDVALSLGFPSGAALGRVLKRCTNESPVALREPGGFGWTLRCFERFLAKGTARP